MTEQRGDRAKWSLVVGARRQLVEAQAEFNRTESRAALLAGALQSQSGWDQLAALTFLDSFVDDIPLLIDELMELSVTANRGRMARALIVRAPREEILPQFARMVPRLLAATDVDSRDYYALGLVFVGLESWSWLNKLIELGHGTVDAEIHEVVDDFAQRYRPMLSQ